MKQAQHSWLITEQYCGTDVADYFFDLDKVFSCTGEKVASDPISQVIKTTVGDKFYYVKRYHAAGKGFRRYFGRSRIRAEWENLITFSRLGVPTPKIVGYGQRVECGRFKCGALITEEIVNSIDLAALVKTQPAILQDKRWRLSVMDQIAEYTRIIHDAGYVHGNLNWRNILVTLSEQPQVYFIDCPAGGLRRGRRLHRDKLNDLVFLDKLGRIHLRLTDQLRFYKRYQRIKKLSVGDKQDIGLIVRSLDQQRLRKQAQAIAKTNNKGADHG